MQNSESSSERLSGVWTALVTPFRGKEIAFDAFEPLIERQIEAGVSGLILLGTTGESPTVEDIEREGIIRRVVAIARKRIPIFVGVGSNNTKHAIRQVSRAEILGADGLLAVTPYYNKPTSIGLRNYFLTLAEATKLPIILYHIPGRCAVGISIDLTLELANHSRIIAIKDAGGDVIRAAEIARLAPKDFALLSGDDCLTLPMISIGAIGVVSVLSNIVPRATVEMVQSALKGDSSNALRLHRRLTPLCQSLFLETSPSPIKAAMNLAGFKVGSVRPPLTGVTPPTRKAIKKALADLGEIH